MKFIELARSRYSVRAYRPYPVEQAKLDQVLEAARLAPTADNRQPFKIIVMHTSGNEKELKRIYSQDWFVQAPLLLCACGIPDRAWARKKDGKNYVDVDVAIVMDHMILAAADLGLGTCWVAAFDPGEAREVLALPAGVEPVAFTPLGYPASEPKPKERKKLSELVGYGRW
jgi:nitroreductase